MGNNGELKQEDRKESEALEINIKLTEDGRLNLTTNCTSSVTFAGMCEEAKRIYPIMQAAKQREKKGGIIQPGRIRDIFPHKRG